MALFKLAVRNLRRNQRRTAITLVAMVVGVTGMVGLRGFINGQQDVLLENIIKGRLGAVQVHRTGYVKNVLTSPLQLDMADTPELRGRLSAAPHVIGVSPRIEFGAMVSTPDKRPQPEDGSDLPEADQGKTSFFLATAIEPESESKVTPRRHGLINKGGRMLPSADAPELVLNDEFARGLEAPVHPAGAPMPPIEQQLALLAGDRDGALNGENMVLGGTLPSFSAGDKRIGVVPLAVAQRVLRMEGHVTEYALALDDYTQADAVRDGLKAKLGPDYEVHTWAELFPFIKSLTGTQDFIFSIITGVFFTVVLLGIVNAMLMTVLERTREIGTMLAVGMRRRQIIRLFLFEGVVIGTVGALLGLSVGLLLIAFTHSRGIPLPAPGANVESIVRPWVSGRFVVGVLLGTPLGAALATLWPAWRASRLRPVEALASA
ncbi:MAG: ABC transporter permease [Archangiaceae bacterium]|nr:ABC transporter permease [Archangiaceae bacterium]